MANTLIKDGQIRRQTRLMPLARARSFAKALQRDPRGLAAEIFVRPEGNRGRVEFRPARAEAILRLFEEQQSAREGRAVDVRRYRWWRIGKRVWRCRGFKGQEYTIWLDGPQCTCPDWHTIRSIGGECKHIICAREAERRYQAATAEGQRAA